MSLCSEFLMSYLAREQGLVVDMRRCYSEVRGRPNIENNRMLFGSCNQKPMLCA